MAAILNFDIQARQNTKMMPEMGSLCHISRKRDITRISMTIYF